MKKLSLKDIEDLLLDYDEGIRVSVLSKTYRVTQGTIYYHLKNKTVIKRKGSTYLSHIEKQIYTLRKKILDGYYSKDELPHAKAELNRLEYWFKVDRSALPCEPFVIQ